MCGRFTLTLKAKDLEQHFKVPAPPDFTYESYNISPSQAVPIIHLDDQQHKYVSLMEWGLLPSWAKSLKAVHRPINARLETIAEKPTFKSAFHKKRCLVPASGFYEWDKRTNPRQPWYFYQKDHSLFAFAGLWEFWEREEGAILSFTLITTAATEPVKPVHERMPVVLSQEHYDRWLYEKALPDKFPPLLSHPVSLTINTPSRNSPGLIEKCVH